MSRLARLLGPKPTIYEQLENNSCMKYTFGSLLRELKLINEFTGEYYGRSSGKKVFKEVCKKLAKRHIGIIVLDSNMNPLKVLKNGYLENAIVGGNKVILYKLN